MRDIRLVFQLAPAVLVGAVLSGCRADTPTDRVRVSGHVEATDVVFAVGLPGAKGTHALVRVLADLAGAGVPAGRIVPVVNQAPKHPRVRAELTAALADLAVPAMGGGRTVAPIFLPSKRVEEAMRDVVPIPAPLPTTLAGAFEATIARLGSASAPAPAEPELVRPGSLGGWYGEEESA